MKTRYTITLAAAVLTLAGCQNDEMVNRQDMDGMTVRYAVVSDCPVRGRAEIGNTGTMLSLTGNGDSLSISMEWTVTDGIGIGPAPDGTKGTLVNTTGDDYKALSEFASLIGNTFVAKAFDDEGAEKVLQTVTWSTTNSAWVGAPEAKWPKGTSLDFLAYANLPGSQTATITKDGVSTVHTVPASAADQKDILFGHYSGNGDNTGTAEIRFEHPLTAVQFKYGEIVDNLKVKSITLEGGAASGTATMTSAGTVNWSDVSAYNKTVSQSNASGLPVDDSSKLLGETFLLIPQTLSDKNVSISVEFTNGDIATGTFDAGMWEKGKTNTYTLGFNPFTYEYTLDLETSSESNINFTNTTSPDTKAISLVSKCTRSDGKVTYAEWVIKSVQVGTADAQTIKAASFENVGGLSAVQTDGASLSITAAAREKENLGFHDYWLNQKPVRTDRLDWSPEDWSSSKATTSNPLDLSRFNFQTETKDDHLMTTANCYIIRHAGTYKLPLVYGNAVVNGTVNEQSYAPSMAEGGSCFLSPFQNHLGKGIASAFIENNEGCGGSGLKCAVVWQDKAEVVKNIQIVNGTSAGTTGSYTTSNVRYLQFTVDNNTICQNNALVCVYNDTNSNGKYDSGEAIWSWHIWTTNDPALLSSPISVTNFTGKEYNFFSIYNLGWIEPTNYPARNDVKIVLAQNESGKEITISVKQDAVLGKSNGCWYQFGRKDPMCTTDSPAQGTYIVKGDCGSTIANAICNPGKFYIATDATKDWLTGTHYYNLWTGKKSISGQYDQDDDVIKTVYDPSPVGYKMPASNVFTGFTSTGENVASGAPTKCNVYGSFNKGWNFYTKPNKQGNTIFFPAAGYRYITNGSISSVGIYGRYWSAVPQDWYFGYHMTLSSTFVYPVNNTHCRCEGYSVRPVQE